MKKLLYLLLIIPSLCQAQFNPSFPASSFNFFNFNSHRVARLLYIRVRSKRCDALLCIENNMTSLTCAVKFCGDTVKMGI